MIEKLPAGITERHERQAAHYRALAETATTPTTKARLLREAEAHGNRSVRTPAL
jgi:hypothetical protein